MSIVRSRVRAPPIDGSWGSYGPRAGPARASYVQTIYVSPTEEERRRRGPQTNCYGPFRLLETLARLFRYFRKRSIVWIFLFRFPPPLQCSLPVLPPGDSLLPLPLVASASLFSPSPCLEPWYELSVSIKSMSNEVPLNWIIMIDQFIPDTFILQSTPSSLIPCREHQKSCNQMCLHLRFPWWAARGRKGPVGLLKLRTVPRTGPY